MGKNSLGLGAPVGNNKCGLGLRWAKVSWVWATMGKKWLGLGNYGQKLAGFGQPWANITRGFGQPWAKISWVWAAMGKK